MMVRMKRELGLSRAQYEAILPALEEREKAREAAFRERRALALQIQAALDKEGTGDPVFADLADRMGALEESERRQDQTLLSEAKKLFTPRQQAQFVLFRQHFRQWLERRMRGLRDGRGPGRVGPGAGQGSGWGAGRDPGRWEDPAGPELDDPPRR